MSIQNQFSGLRGFENKSGSERFSNFMRDVANRSADGNQAAGGQAAGGKGSQGGPQVKSPFIADGNPNQGAGGAPSGPGIGQPTTPPAPGGSPFIADGNPNQFVGGDEPAAGPPVVQGGGTGITQGFGPFLDGNLIQPASEVPNVELPGTSEAPATAGGMEPAPSSGVIILDNPPIADGNREVSPLAPISEPAPSQGGGGDTGITQGFGPFLDGNLIQPASEVPNVELPGSSEAPAPPGVVILDNPPIADGNRLAPADTPVAEVNPAQGGGETGAVLNNAPVTNGGLFSFRTSGADGSD